MQVPVCYSRLLLQLCAGVLMYGGTYSILVLSSSTRPNEEEEGFLFG